MPKSKKPIVVITGAVGDIGSALIERLHEKYTFIGLDRDIADLPAELIKFDLTNDDSVELAFRKIRDTHGKRIASVVHLAAYFDFTGDESPLYDAVNVEGTRRLLRVLKGFDVGQFVYSGTMLVHEPCEPGEQITEDTPIRPTWAYPQSKARTEEVIREEAGQIPYVLLHLA